MIRAIYVLYDESCAFCVRCAEWLEAQPAHVGLYCLASDSKLCRQWFPDLVWSKDKRDLVVVDEFGGVYRDAEAWLMTLWALRDYRAWAIRLAAPALRPLARQAFALLSVSRSKLSLFMRGTVQLNQTLLRAKESGVADSCHEEGAACQTNVSHGPEPGLALPKSKSRPCQRCGHRRSGTHGYCSTCLADVLEDVQD